MDNISKLYADVSKKLYIGTEDKIRGLLSTKEGAEKFYNVMKDKGVDLGNHTDFMVGLGHENLVEEKDAPPVGVNTEWNTDVDLATSAAKEAKYQADLAQNKLEWTQKQNPFGGSKPFGRVDLGVNDKVVKSDNGQWLTESGRTYDNFAEANLDQNLTDQHNSQSYRLSRMQEQLGEMKDRSGELLKESKKEDEKQFSQALGMGPYYGSMMRHESPNTTAIRKAQADLDDAQEALNELYRQRAEGGETNYIKNSVDFWKNLGSGNIKDAAKNLVDAGNDGLTTLKRVGRGFSDTAGDLSNWDFGVTDATHEGILLSAILKRDNGQPLTKQEQFMLDSAALRAGVTNEVGDLGLAYTSGNVTAASLPFMIEMMANPLSGLGKGATKALTKYVVKKYGKEAVKNNMKKYLATKAVSRVSGDIAGSLGMTATSGFAGTAANAAERQIGSVQTAYDENGNIVYGGHVGGEDALTAWTKGVADRTIENWSEMSGAYFAALGAPIKAVIGKGIGRIVPDKVLQSDFAQWATKKYGDLKNSKFYKGVDAVKSRAQIGGLFEEYLEEKFGDLMRLSIGDTTFDTNSETGIFNLERNVETLVSLIPTQVGFGMLRLGGARTANYQYRQQRKAADKYLDGVLGENWKALRMQLDAAQHDPTAIAQIYSNMNQIGGNIPINVRRAVMNYINAQQSVLHSDPALYQSRTDRVDIQEQDGKFVASDKDAMGNVLGNKTFETREEADAYATNRMEETRDDDMHRFMQTARGLNMVDYNQTAEQFMQERGFDNMTAEEQAEFLDEMSSGRGKTGKAWIEFKTKTIENNMSGANFAISSWEQAHGLEPGTIEDILDRQPTERTIDENDILSEAYGMLHDLAYPQGKAHVEQSKLDGIRLADEANLDAVMDVNEEGASEAKPDLAELAQLKLERETSHNIALNTLRSDTDMLTVFGEVMGNNGADAETVIQTLASMDEETLQNTLVDVMNEGVHTEKFQSVVDAVNAQAKYNSFIQRTGEKIDEKVERESNRRVFKGTLNGAQYTDKPTIITATDGEHTYQIVNSTEDIVTDDKGNVTSQGVFTAIDENGNVAVFKGSTALRIDAEEELPTFAETMRQGLQEAVSEVIEPTTEEEIAAENAEGTAAETQSQPTENAGAADAAAMPQPTENTENAITAAAEPQTASEEVQEEEKPSYTKSKMVYDEKGNEAFDRMPIADTMEELLDGQLEDEQVVELIDNNIEAYKKEVAKLNEKKPKKTTSRAELIAATNKLKADRAEAERKLKYWQDVKAELAKITHTTEEEMTALSEAENPSDAELGIAGGTGAVGGATDTMPVDGIAMASGFLGNNAVKITPESFRAETGFGTKEQRGFVGMFAGKAKGGKTINEIAEALVEYDNAYYGGNYFKGDSQEARNAVISAFGQARTKADLRANAVSNRDTLLSEWKQKRDDYYYEEFGMSYDDYMAYEGEILKDDIRREAGVDTAAMFADADEEREETVAETESQPAENITEEEGETEAVPQSTTASAPATPTDAKEPFRARAREWSKKTGVDVVLLESIDDVESDYVRGQIIAAEKNNQQVKGWYSQNTGKVFIYMPHAESEEDIEVTFIHEVVAHKGLKELLGKSAFDSLCDNVFEMMSPEAQAKFLDYVGAEDINNPTEAEKRAAADEYIAHLAENTDLTDAEKSVWDNIVKIIRTALETLGLSISITDDVLSNLIKASYAEMVKNRRSEESDDENEGSEQQGVRLSVKAINNESPTIQSQTSELGQPTTQDAPLANLNANVQNATEISNELNKVLSLINSKGALSGHELLFELSKAFSLDKEKTEFKNSEYYPLADGVTLRLADHYANTNTFETNREFKNNYGLVIKLSNNRFKKNPNVGYLEYVYFPDKLDKERQSEIVEGLMRFIQNGDFNSLPTPDKVNTSGDIRFRTVYHGSGADFEQFDHSHMGEGEGAQVFGWGTYVTEEEGVGKRYAVTTLHAPLISDTNFESVRDKNPKELMASLNKIGMMIEGLSFPEVQKYLQDRFDVFLADENYKGSHDVIERLANANMALTEEDVAAATIGSHLYKVDIPDDTGMNYLYWSDVVPKEIENVVKTRLLEKLSKGESEANKIELKQKLNDVFRFSDYTGRSLYHIVSSYLGGNKSASEFLHNLGIVGIKYPTNILSGGNNDGSSNYVIFNEDDLEIVERTRFRIANDNQEIFVSNAEQAVKGIKQEKATPQQWKAMIQSKGGLKAGEDKWLGLSEWLDEQATAKRSLTKQEVLDFIGENKIRIEEVEYSDASSNDAFTSLKEEYDQWLREGGYDYAWEQLTDRYGDDAEIAFMDLAGELTIGNEEAAAALLGENVINSTRLDYTTEGLENKREIALTVPTIESWNESDDIHFGDAGQGRAVAWVRFGETITYETIDDVQEVTEFHKPYENLNRHDVYKPVGSFKSGDYVVHGKGRDGSMIYVVYINDKQLPVAHTTLEEARNAMNEYYREHPRKLRKAQNILVIDEIQSKRHQEGREQGYAPKKTVTKDMLRDARAKENQMRTALEEKYGKPFGEELPVSERAEARRQWVANLSEEDRNAWMNQRELVENYLTRLDEQSVGIPDAPFDKNWHELAMKRMLRLAAEEGFDKVAWTKGEQQAERYQLSAVVDHISYFENEDGTLDARAYSPYGGYQPIGKTWEEVERYVGKDIAKKMQEGVSESTENLTWGMDRDGNNIVKEYKTISGDNLKVGGEGMKGFYDKMLPSFMNKYGKKWGVKVEEVELPEVEEAGRTMWSVDVTPEMKESVMEGQVMFRKNTLNNEGEGESTQELFLSLQNKEGEEYNDTVNEIADRIVSGRARVGREDLQGRHGAQTQVSAAGDIISADRGRVSETVQQGSDASEESTRELIDRFRVTNNANNLVVMHNISEGDLRKVLETGGLIMPSIAITDVNIGFSGFGDISLLFDKETINPSDRRNKVYGGDAWTPRFPQLVPKLNKEKVKSVADKLYELLSKDLQDYFGLSSEVHSGNIEDNIIRGGIASYYSKDFMKIAYLLGNGKKFKVPMKPKPYGRLPEIIIRLAKEKGVSLDDINNAGYEFYENNPDFVDAIKLADAEARTQNLSSEAREKVRDMILEKPMHFSSFDRAISAARSMEHDLNNGGLKQVVDGEALYEAINKKVKTDNADYNKWVDDLFDGIVEKYGIRNNKDWYTPSGNRRSWEQLYDAATPSNILRYMIAQNTQGGSGGLFDSSIFGASAEEYKSIEEIRERGKKRLHKEESDDYDEWIESVTSRISDIKNEFLTPSERNDFRSSADANDAIVRAVAKDKAAKGIYSIMKRDYRNFTMEHAKMVADIVKEIQDKSVTYFEAKPQRIVSLSEIRKAIVPSNVDSDIIEGLQKNGIEVATYRRGNENARNRLIKKESNEIRFRFIGEQGAANLDKAEEATTRLDNLNVAREMEEAGKDAKSIKMATGWERGADKKWRYEVDDDIKIDLSANVDFRRRHPEYARYEELKNKELAAVLELGEPMTEEEHKEYDFAKTIFGGDTELHRSRKLKDYVESESLFKNYPELAAYSLNIVDEMEDGASGSFNPDTKAVTLKMSFKVGEMEKVLVHELQHAIQHIEGFAQGGNTRSVQTKAETLKKDVQPLYEMIHDTPEWAEYKMLVNDYFDEYGKDQPDYDKIAEIESRLNEIEDSGVLKEIESKRKELKRKYGADATVTKILNGPYSSFDEIWEQLPSGFYDKFDAYYRLGGEVEARNAVERMGMSTEERRASLAEETEDVAREDQIFIFDGLESAAMPQSTMFKMTDTKSQYDEKVDGLNKGIEEKGLRGHLGEVPYKKMMRTVYEGNDEIAQNASAMLQDKEWNLYDSIETYLADEAQTMGNEEMWQDVRQSLANAVDFFPSIKDTKYAMWLNKNRGNDPSDPNDGIKRNALLYKLEREEREAPVRFRTTPTPVADQAARAQYEKALKQLGYRWSEQWIDGTRSVAELQKAMFGKNFHLADSRDAHEAEKAMTSKIMQKQRQYHKHLVEPLGKAIEACMKDMPGKSRKERYENLKKYMYALHGLERNRYIHVRDIVEDEQQLEDYVQYCIQQRQKLDRGNITLPTYFAYLDSYIRQKIDKDFDADKIDKSGLRDEFPTDADALYYIEATNSRLKKERVNELWRRVRDVNDFALETEYQSGLISGELKAKVASMYGWYIPLRGFEEMTAEEEYDYNNTEVRAVGGPTLMGAKGRKSKADDPIATMLSIGSQAIHRAERNEVKKKFYRAAKDYMKTNGQGGLVSELFVWEAKVGTDNQGNDIYEVQFPDLTEDMSASEVANEIANFEALMKDLADKGEARQVRQGMNLNKAFEHKKSLEEHIVRVYENGQVHVLYLNGNPRAAQSLNGTLKTNEKNVIIKAFRKLQRAISQMMTSLNPTFALVANPIRDYQTALMNTLINDGVLAGGKFMLEHAKSFAGLYWYNKMFKLYRKGKLDMNNKEHELFKEFADNGGITGFIESSAIEDYKSMMDGMLRTKTWPTITRFLDKSSEFLSTGNTLMENMARFATYKAARKRGLSIQKSVKRAKDYSLNFNQRGLANGEGVIGSLAWLFNFCYLFVNPTMQAFGMMVNNFKNHPAKTTFYQFAVPPMMASMIVPVLNIILASLLDDDDDDDIRDIYGTMPEWKRRNNICLYAGNGHWVTIPLPIELRAFYGIGEILASELCGDTEMGKTFGWDKMKSDRPAEWQIFDLLMTLTPTSIVYSGGGIEDLEDAFVMTLPQVLKPIGELVINKKWTGAPIWNDSDYIKYNPEWQKAYSNTNPYIVEFCRWLNKATGGNDVRPNEDASWGNINPAKIDHIIQGYFGGFYKALSEVGAIGKLIMSGNADAIRAEQVPLLKAIWYNYDEAQQAKRYNALYYKYKEEAEKTTAWERGYTDRGDIDGLLKLMAEPRYKRRELINDYETERQKFSAGIRKSHAREDEDTEEVFKRIRMLSDKAIVEELDKIK